MNKNRIKEKNTNLLELTPVRNIQWKKNKEGLILLLKPKVHNQWLAKFILPRLKNPYYSIRLDEVGTFVWEKCDGQHTVRELAGHLKDRFGDKVEPVYDRLALFLQGLEKSRFIVYQGI
ncbi:MAG: PqqD family protein [Candidatus Aminicenantes bacterium]